MHCQNDTDKVLIEICKYFVNGIVPIPRVVLVRSLVLMWRRFTNMGCSDSKATEVVDPILDEKPDEVKETPHLQQQEKEVTFLENCSVSQLDNEPAVSQPESIVNASETSLSKFPLLSLGEAPYERQIYKQQGAVR